MSINKISNAFLNANERIFPRPRLREEAKRVRALLDSCDLTNSKPNEIKLRNKALEELDLIDALRAKFPELW